MDLYFNVGEFIDNFQTKCKMVQKKSFIKNEVITTYIAKRNQICILVSGSADLVRYDFNGNRSIIDHFTKNDIFGEVFYNITTNNELLVEAKENSEVLFFPYDQLNQRCRNNCKFHQVLSDNIPELILRKITTLNTKIELLTRRNIREKLLGYFNILSTQNLSKSFILPQSLTDLADYLNVDRSAMMREIKLLKEEHIIDKKSNKITLLVD